MKSLAIQGAEVEVNRDFTCPNLFTPAKKYSIGTHEQIEALAADLEAHKLQIPAFCLHNRFDENPDEEIAWTMSVARASQKLGVKVIRIDVVPRRLSGEEFFKFAVQTCKQLVEQSEKTGVKFGIENHGGTTNQVEFLERLFGAVGSDRLGLTLDVANFYWFGYPLDELYGIYRKFAKRVFHTHCKSIAYPKEMQNTKRSLGWEYGKYNCPIYEGDIDFKRVLDTLRGVGYEGALCVENESLSKFPEPERADVLTREVKFLRELLS
jgi:sugar phosphate isomerase/epimerase